MKATPKHQIGKVKVTDKELQFLKLYHDSKNKDTFLDAGKCGRMVYGEKNESIGHQVLKRPRIMSAIKELFSHPDYDTFIDKGARKILKNPKDKFFTRMVELVFKVRDDLAPEKHLNLNMTPDDVEREKQEVMKALRSAYGKTEKIGLTGDEYRAQSRDSGESAVSNPTDAGRAVESDSEGIFKTD